MKSYIVKVNEDKTLEILKTDKQKTVELSEGKYHVLSAKELLETIKAFNEVKTEDQTERKAKCIEQLINALDVNDLVLSDIAYRGE